MQSKQSMVINWSNKQWSCKIKSYQGPNWENHSIGWVIVEQKETWGGQVQFLWRFACMHTKKISVFFVFLHSATCGIWQLMEHVPEKHQLLIQDTIHNPCLWSMFIAATNQKAFPQLSTKFWICDSQVVHELTLQTQEDLFTTRGTWEKKTALGTKTAKEQNRISVLMMAIDISWNRKEPQLHLKDDPCNITHSHGNKVTAIRHLHTNILMQQKTFENVKLQHARKQPNLESKLELTMKI